MTEPVGSTSTHPPRPTLTDQIFAQAKLVSDHSPDVSRTRCPARPRIQPPSQTTDMALI